MSAANLPAATPPHPAPAPALPLFVRPFAWAERWLVRLLSYPLLTIQIVLFWLIAWGGLGADLGLDDLFWHEDAFPQFMVGLSMGLLFAQILFVRYLIDRRRWQARFAKGHISEERAAWRLGRFLLFWWPLCVAILILPKLLTLKNRDDWMRHAPLLVGLAVSALLTLLLGLLFERFGLRARVQRSALFRFMPGIAWGYVPQEDYPLNALALLVGVLFAAGVAAAAVLHAFGFSLVTPYLVIALILGIANTVYGYLSGQLPGLQIVVLLLILLSAVLFNSDTFDPGHVYRMSFPNMEPYYTAARAAVSDVARKGDIPPASEHFIRLDEEEHRDPGQRPIDHYRKLLQEADHSAQAAGLIDSEQPLRALAERWRQKRPGGKPRVVIVCTSGGGIRAAVWTAVVLEGLEETVPGLRDHIRLVAGASGGMVGAGLYVADFEHPCDPKDVDPETGLGSLSKLLARDSLTPTVQTMLLTDLPGIWTLGPAERDRGRELEQTWSRNLRRPGQEGSALGRSFKELRELEAQGRRPSLVYSPMLVEDSRRLLISNLDLDALTISYSQQLAGSSFAEKGAIEDDRDPAKANLRTQRSLSAVEFFRLFPKATAFQVGTAARMNASFPLVSPAVYLPTYPARRVVDTGYYDNYGAHVAALWLWRHRQAIREHTSGVLIVEIRAYRNGYARRHFQDRERLAAQAALGPEQEGEPKGESRSKDLVSQFLEGLATPAEAILTTRDRASMYRNDELLDLLDEALNTPADRDFFTTVAFECHKDAALSWMLSKDDERNIVRSFWETTDHRKLRSNIQRRIDPIRKWFGDGGK